MWCDNFWLLTINIQLNILLEDLRIFAWKSPQACEHGNTRQKPVYRWRACLAAHSDRCDRDRGLRPTLNDTRLRPGRESIHDTFNYRTMKPTDSCYEPLASAIVFSCLNDRNSLSPNPAGLFCKNVFAKTLVKRWGINEYDELSWLILYVANVYDNSYKENTVEHHPCAKCALNPFCLRECVMDKHPDVHINNVSRISSL